MQVQNIFVDEAAGIQFTFLRSKDLGRFLGHGRLDGAFLGADVALETGADTESDVVFETGLARCSFELLVRSDFRERVQKMATAGSELIVTSYPNLTARWAAEVGVKRPDIMLLDGQLEAIIGHNMVGAALGTDVVQTGSTAREFGLARVDKFMDSQLGLYARLREGDSRQTRLDDFRQAFESILLADGMLKLEYNLPNDPELLAQAERITPGFNGPSVSIDQAGKWVTVVVMINAKALPMIRRELLTLGADGILSSKVDAVSSQTSLADAREKGLID
jgi:ATP phosphoribosyltransferase